MKLDDALEKYPDEVMMRRKDKPNFEVTISWLRQLKAWGNTESRELGFLIPQFMIDDAEASDWELCE